MMGLYWPAKGTVVAFVNNFNKYISSKLHESDVYLEFEITAQKVLQLKGEHLMRVG